MSQNKILKDIAIKLGATVGEHVNDTNELLTAIAVALGATPTKKYNNVKDTLELIRDNISEGGSGGSTLKTYLDSVKTCENMFNKYAGDNISDLITYGDTENANSFCQMFKSCSNATNIPQLDTSKGTNFGSMYYGCSNVTSFPQLDTSNGTDFNHMYDSCSNATSFPQLDTSNGTTFASMYHGCSNATSFPQLDTSNGTTFASMYDSCLNATSFPQLDTSKGTAFSNMYYGCLNATNIPPLDTSNMSYCNSMFQNCSKVVKLDISYYKINNSSTSSKWCAGCKSLKALIIRGFASTFTLASDAFDDCYHLKGKVNATYNPEGLKDCYIYIPRNQISLLEQSASWSSYKSQFRVLEDYTVDGTTTGEFDDAKAGL